MERFASNSTVVFVFGFVLPFIEGSGPSQACFCRRKLQIKPLGIVPFLCGGRFEGLFAALNGRIVFGRFFRRVEPNDSGNGLDPPRTKDSFPFVFGNSSVTIAGLVYLFKLTLDLG